MEAPASNSAPMETDDQAKQQKQSSSRRSSSSHSSTGAPSYAQLRRTIRLIQEDQEEQADEIIALKRQLLWSMQQQVRADRKACSSQVVVQGLPPAVSLGGP